MWLTQLQARVHMHKIGVREYLLNDCIPDTCTMASYWLPCFSLTPYLHQSGAVGGAGMMSCMVLSLIISSEHNYVT